jgi:putative peptidoglycan lipid II flippase
MTEPPEKQTSQRPGSGDGDDNDHDDSAASMSQRMGLATLLLSASILLSRILGFIREAAVAYFHGATPATDAYYAAFTLPDLMNYFLAGGTLSITFIPLFSSYVEDNDEAGGWALFSNIATIMGTALIVGIIVLELVAPYAVPIANPGFNSGEQIDLAVWMTRIVIPAQLAFYLGGLLQATLFVRETFWPSAVAPLIYNICIIAGGVLLEPWFGIAGFSVGVLAGAFLGPFLIPLWAAWDRVRYQPAFDLWDPDFRKFIALTLPLMIGVSLLTVDQWLLRYFGSYVDGAITWLNDARKLMLVIFAMIGQAAGQAALPYLTRLYHQGREDDMGEMLSRQLGRIGYLAMVGAAGLMVAAGPLVWVVFRRGAFTAADAQRTSGLLMIFALGLLGWTLQSLSVRAFYARKDTLTPMLIGTGVVAVSLPVYWIGFKWYGPSGLAGASAFGITLNALLTLVIYKWLYTHIAFRPIAAGVARGGLFGAVCYAGAYFTRMGIQSATGFEMGGFFPTFGLLVTMGIGFFAAGGLIAIVYRPPELEAAVERVGQKLPG